MVTRDSPVDQVEAVLEGTAISPAVVSIDVDPVHVHLAGYGVEARADGLVHDVAVPRLLDLLAEAKVPATFFVIARDAVAAAPWLAAIVGGGHEVASHTMTHPMPLERLPPARLRAELATARERLSEATGTDVIGFRAPNWDIGRRAIAELVRSGHQYDASGFPTPLLVPARGLLALKSRSPRPLTAMHPWPHIWRTRPHRIGPAPGLLEVPITVTGPLRMPLYHTARFLPGGGSFERRLDGIMERRQPFFYPLHAVDVIGIEDGVDPRLARHPGMTVPVEQKLDLLRDSLAAIAARFRPMTYADFVARDIGVHGP